MFFQENGQYRCAVYLRLSRSDGDQQESNSIKKSKSFLLNDYLGKHSGTNFERPDFKRMMQDIEKRNVNCIIVKDLSRFGRNYIETGRYLERIFPFMGVRFIAINDHYDSAEENDDKGRILIPFNNLINDIAHLLPGCETERRSVHWQLCRMSEATLRALCRIKTEKRKEGLPN